MQGSGRSWVDAPSGGSVEDSSVGRAASGRAASGKGDEDREAVRSVTLETMPIRSGTEEGTWSDMLKASE